MNCVICPPFVRDILLNLRPIVGAEWAENRVDRWVGVTENNGAGAEREDTEIGLIVEWVFCRSRSAHMLWLQTTKCRRNLAILQQYNVNEQTMQ